MSLSRGKSFLPDLIALEKAITLEGTVTMEANSIYRIDNKAQYYSFVKIIVRHSFLSVRCWRPRFEPDALEKRPPRESEEELERWKACAVAVLLLILLVVYVAVVSAPIFMRLARLILAGNGLRELTLPRGTTAARSGGTKKRYQCRPISAAPKWLQHGCPAIGRD